MNSAMLCCEWFGLVFKCWMFVYNILGNMGTLNYVPNSGVLVVVLGCSFSPTPAKLRPLEEVWLVPCASAKGGRWEGPC